ncbi:MAG: 16S rRNA (guanine(966)-N(2))-methyltransferase RsmD [Desulfuromonadales bacterium]|nr:16S rRNA (guanine(966)-N(2))-methyltransferase RsmD [Desulfuromonadales bacterium]
MRVIAGTSRGRRLALFEGHNVRPTPDRVREALFSILQSKLGGFSNLRVLDLFAGSGALAIEALSRGATSACLVDKAPASEKIIRENLNLCQLSDKAKVITRGALQALPELSPGTFDLVFLDPPYSQGLVEDALVEIDRLSILNKDGIICAETGADEILPESVGQLQRIDQRRYGTIMISFYESVRE